VRRDAQRLRDVLEAVAAIERHTGRGRVAFDSDELVRVWCLKHIEIIGEALGRLSDDFKAAHRDLPWREATAMRNQLVHGYFQVDWAQVWNVVERDLPAMKRAATQFLLELGDH
jgi:uncharacterized protein with HEPN domain